LLVSEGEKGLACWPLAPNRLGPAMSAIGQADREAGRVARGAAAVNNGPTRELRDPIDHDHVNLFWRVHVRATQERGVTLAGKQLAVEQKRGAMQQCGRVLVARPLNRVRAGHGCGCRGWPRVVVSAGRTG